MLWFGFGYKGFGELGDLSLDSPEPVQLHGAELGNRRISKAIPAWSYTAFLTEDGSVVLSGLVGGCHVQDLCLRGLKSHDILPTEKYLMLLFTDWVGCWDISTVGSDGTQGDPIWKMDFPDGHNAAFPLVANGHIATNAPFFRELPAKCHAHKLVLGNEHAVMITSDWTLFTWGAGRHGQLGHGDLEDVSEPRIVEALHGIATMEVAAGGWHSGAISEGGDIYCWGWNEFGQLGLPSKSLTQERACTQKISTEGENAETSEFITIQAFPALIDLPEETEAAKISCGSRHTAVVTRSGELYTWGWGKYGQLGHRDTMTLDQPKCVKYFSMNHLRVENVTCRHWNTYVSCHHTNVS
ncbi:RCC1 domain-containing protein 1 [Discoglossus pictus]